MLNTAKKPTDTEWIKETVLTPLNQLYLAGEAPKGQKLTVRDSGSGSPLSDAELKASLYENGVIVPLIFKTVDGKRYVIAGNRRLRLLRNIFLEADRGSPDMMVPTQDVEAFNGDWREIAINTNLSLPPHLVERYEQIVTIAKDLKLSPEDTRSRFGMSEQQYRRVMALGKMSETVRAAWKAGEIDAKTAKLFTLEPDTKEQDRVFASAKKNGWRGRIQEHEVRSKIVPTSQREAGQLVAFVGLEECKKAKLIKQEDLFADDDDSTGNHIITDIKALKKLAGDKMAARCRELVEAGWKWALPEDSLAGNSWSYQSIDPAKKSAPTDVEKARMDEIEKYLHADDDGQEDFEAMSDEQDRLKEEIKQRGYTPEQRAKTGCILKLGHGGNLTIEYGRMKPEERKKVEASERSATKAKAKASKPDGVVLTNALAQRLSEQLQKAGAEALKKSHVAAASAIIAAFSSGGHVLDIHVHGSGGRKANAFTDVFLGAYKSTPQQREAMLAQIAAQALSIVTFNGAGKQPLEDEGTLDLFDAMSNVGDEIHRAFDAKDYFASVSLSTVVSAVRCSMGDDHAAKVAKMKKADAAKFATANVKGWLPKELRTGWYTGPVEGAKKDKKPKPVKKAPKKKTRK